MSYPNQNPVVHGRLEPFNYDTQTQQSPLIGSTQASVGPEAG
jgi:hypothetical protein